MLEVFSPLCSVQFERSHDLIICLFDQVFEELAHRYAVTSGKSFQRQGGGGADPGVDPSFAVFSRYRTTFSIVLLSLCRCFSHDRHLRYAVTARLIRYCVTPGVPTGLGSACDAELSTAACQTRFPRRIGWRAAVGNSLISVGRSFWLPLLDDSFDSLVVVVSLF